MSDFDKERLIQATLEKAGIWTRMFEHGLHPKLSTWVYLDKGKPTVDTGILLLTKGDQCVGMYHLTDGRILVSRIGFGPGGIVGLSQFAHQMAECKGADDLFERIPKLLSAQKVAKQEVEIFLKDMRG